MALPFFIDECVIRSEIGSSLDFIDAFILHLQEFNSAADKLANAATWLPGMIPYFAISWVPFFSLYICAKLYTMSLSLCISIWSKSCKRTSL